MFTVPVVIVALAAALVLSVGIAVGGGALLVFAALGLGLLGISAVLYRRADREITPLRLPGSAHVGVATVLDYRDVGATVRDESIVEVTLRISVPGWPPYDVRLCDVVSLYASSRLATDAAFRCAVDPAHPRDIVVHWEQPVALDGVSDPQNRLGVYTPVRTDASLSAAAVLASGLPGIARVVQSSSQGTVAPNGDPIMIFILHVVPDDGTPPFQSLTAQRVPPERLALTAAGTQVSVAYDPDNRTRMVAIDWDAAVRAQEVTTVFPGAFGEQRRRGRSARPGRAGAPAASGSAASAGSAGSAASAAGGQAPPVAVSTPQTSG